MTRLSTKGMVFTFVLVACMGLDQENFPGRVGMGEGGWKRRGAKCDCYA